MFRRPIGFVVKRLYVLLANIIYSAHFHFRDRILWIRLLQPLVIPSIRHSTDLYVT